MALRNATRGPILTALKEATKDLTVHLVDYGSIKLGTPQSKLLLDVRNLIVALDAMEKE